MRKISALVAVMGLAAAGLVGCSAAGTSAASCDRPESDAGLLAPVSVSGPLEDAPEVDVPTPFRLNTAAFEDIDRGDGTPILREDQLVIFDLSLVSGSTGQTLFESAYDGTLTAPNPVTAWTQTFPGLEDALQCATAGSRVLAALTPDEIDPQAAEGLGIPAGDTVLAVVDIRRVYLDRADGADQYNSALGLPTVVRAPDGRPGIIVPDADPPADLVVQTLKKGDGPAVTADAPARVNYIGVTWAERTVFDTTWGAQAASLTIDGVVPGLADALRGATVGSQLLVVIPPDLGYGDQAQGTIPAGSTLVFVVDILGIDPPAAG